MNLLITICARGGSKGIPGKNIRPLNGLPLLAYSIRTAKEFSGQLQAGVDLALSTDDAQIKKVGADYGLITDYIRPAILANDTAGKVDAIHDVLLYQEALNEKRYDLVLDLDVSSPLRNATDLHEGLQLMLRHEGALNLFSVSKAVKNPYFNMVEEGADGFFHLSKTPGNTVLSRQTAPKVYELNASFYYYRRAFFEQGFRSVYSGKSIIYEMNHTCFDLDHEIDFAFLEFLMANNKLDFQL